ncbi:VOC family protein [Aliiroseovarius sp. F20344]|uniref:VOC family protein n=1 Tax=Aliiroseovarius sp. F20344 TaxID=2926414 RepID=UPI001FF2D0E2|nr:VOC family protein [Aliiroseovarius sp. F20344]MCK0141849.1 VOC family protein [Aliiroseovarius sp. F20344]
MLLNLHHVQLAMPKGHEDEARAFYADLLGLSEEPKPDALLGRGGVWFCLGDLRVHLGVETPFQPARKAHPAFEVADLDALGERLKQAGCRVRIDEKLPDYNRFYTEDPFGNRIECLERAKT